jgi:hypothetical protein
VADPTSWLMVEPGYSVSAPDGEEIGKVDQVLGDNNADIFDGLAILTGVVGKPKYVPSELVASIDTDAVRLTIGKEELDSLDEYTPPEVDAP